MVSRHEKCHERGKHGCGFRLIVGSEHMLFFLIFFVFLSQFVPIFNEIVWLRLSLVENIKVRRVKRADWTQGCCNFG